MHMGEHQDVLHLAFVVVGPIGAEEALAKSATSLSRPRWAKGIQEIGEYWESYVCCGAVYNLQSKEKREVGVTESRGEEKNE
jgi:hypothetical protein